MHLAGAGLTLPPPPTPYASLTEEQQVAHLREVAEQGAREFGIEPTAIELVLHGFNTTFKVTGRDGVPVAMRVNTNSLSTPAHVVAQSAWMADLARDTDLRLPVPRLTMDGSPFAAIDDRLVTVASWLEGENVGVCEPVHAHLLGRLMATMHDHAQHWQLPSDGHLDVFSDPFFGDEDRLSTACDDRPDVDVLRRAVRRCSEALTSDASTGSAHIVHADLHGGNLKWTAGPGEVGTLSVFDFDDCGIATEALDLAIATFYLRRSDPEVETALRQGYAEIRALPELEDLEALVAGRQLLLANDLLRSSTPEFQRMAIGYLDTTLERLTRWEESGHFRL